VARRDAQEMAVGENGKNGPSVPRPVGEDFRRGGDLVTTLLPSMVEMPVKVTELKRDSATLTLLAQLMAVGECGPSGPNAPSRVVEELRKGRESVTILLRKTVVKHVLAMSLNRECVTRSFALVMIVRTPTSSGANTLPKRDLVLQEDNTTIG